MSRDEMRPLIDEMSAAYLARVINRAAESFDVADLSAEEAVAAHMVLDRLTDALWREHKRVLFPLYQALITRLGLSDDDPNGDNSR